VGTRFFVRGADDKGRVANFVETEQVVEAEGGPAVVSYFNKWISFLLTKFLQFLGLGLLRTDSRLHANAMATISQHSLQASVSLKLRSFEPIRVQRRHKLMFLP
jgi:hypothetical protein